MRDNLTSVDKVVESGNVAGGEPQEGAESPDAGNKGLDLDAALKELKAARSEAAKYRTERNALKADAEAYRKIQEDNKTDLQKAQEALQAAESSNKELSAQLARMTTAAKFGISEDNLELLGSDPERFEELAGRIADLQKQAMRQVPSDYPVESLVSGASGKAAKPEAAYPSSWGKPTGQFATK